MLAVPSFLPHLSLFGRSAGPFLVPAKTASATARSHRQGRPSGRRGTRLVLDAGEPDRMLLRTGARTGKPRVWRATASLLLAVVLAGAVMGLRPARAEPLVAAVNDIDAAVAEASARFGLSKTLIWAVLRAESGGRADAVSRKGAMGLMQLMPATWRDMRVALRLGDDPFQPRDNILAGAGYLSALYDRFGSPGYLAAYNAGPGRYQQHLDGAAFLPSETLAYVDDVQRRATKAASQGRSAAADWRASGMFVEAREGNDPRPIFVPRPVEVRQ